MTAYLISEVVVQDQSALQKYRDIAAATHAAYGGRYVVRGGEITVLEGDRHPKLLIIVEFADVDTAKRWYASDEYAEALQYRDAAFSNRSLMILEGFKPPV
jgi:uncharacterized protein (DUF1330 family)